MPVIKHTVTINAPADQVFQALTNEADLAGWWAECQTNAIEGGEAKFAFEPGNYVRWRIENLYLAN